MKAAGISDRGKVRENNEDRYLIHGDNALAVYAVADGMGGHAAGEVASSMALETIRRYLDFHRDAFLEAVAAGESVRPLLEEMLETANKEVLRAGSEQPGCNGMGTTITLLLAVFGQYWLAHIGDSRAYLIRNSEILHLTEDHTLVSQLLRSGQICEDEASGHPQRHILTRALGTDGVAVFDIMRQTIRPGESVLLCTDGLHGLVDKEEIWEVVQNGGEPEEILPQLVDLANERGGTDNIAAVLVKIL